MVHQSQHPEAIIEEQFIQSKTGDPDDCEDALYINEYFVAVIDGATSKTLDLDQSVVGEEITVATKDLHRIRT